MKIIKKLSLFCCCTFFTSLLTACSKDSYKADDLSDITNITFKDFSEEISSDSIYNNIAKLSYKDDARLSGFEGEQEAAEFITKEFENIGLNVEAQEFDLMGYKCSKVEFNVTSLKEESIEAKALTFSIGTKGETINTKIVDGNMGTVHDLTKTSVKDKLVLIKRGGETFRDKTKRAASLGALGVIFYDPNSEDIISGTLVEQTTIPAVAISKQHGEKLLSSLIAKEELNCALVVESEIINTKSKNIIAELKSKKADAKTLIVGAHYDGVDTLAANDNASGISTVLEVAKVLSDENLDCNIKFIAFGAEESGLIGSSYYVRNLNSEELEDIIAMINADMVGIGDSISVKTADLTKDSLTLDIAVECMKYFNYNNRIDEGDRSDHLPFELAGIPVAYFEYGAYENYHTDKDTIDKISKENLDKICNVISSLSFEIGKNPQRFE